jgi:hypothetical protein
MARAIYPPITRSVGYHTQDSGLNPLGSTGSNIYICTDYMSPQHVDDDANMCICIQLKKRSRDDEFNFAYTEWGVFIETIENCMW